VTDEAGPPPRPGPGPQRGRAFAALALLALGWGYAWVVLKIATRDGAPLAVAVLRNGIGAVALLAFLAATRRPLRPPPFGPTFVLGLLQTVGFTIPQTVAVALGGAGKTAVLAYTMPFWLVLLAAVFLGERLTRGRLAALALAGVGLALVIGPLHSGSALPSLLGVLSGIIWAASAVWALRALLRRGYDLLSATAWQAVWGSLVLAALALAFPGPVRWSPEFVGSVLFLGLVANALGWALWAYVLTILPASVAGLGSLATPVVGVASAAVQLGELPTRAELAGMAFIVVALAVNARAGGSRR